MTKFFLGVLLLLGCHSSPHTENNRTDTSAKVTTQTSTVPNTDRSVEEETKRPLFNNRRPYEIISVVSSLNKNTTDEDTLKCASWTLNKESISHIITNSKPIDGTTWDLGFLVLACTKSVKVLQGKQQFDIEINAGSFFSVSNGDTTTLYGDFNKTDKKYFIEPPSDE